MKHSRDVPVDIESRTLRGDSPLVDGLRRRAFALFGFFVAFVAFASALTAQAVCVVGDENAETIMFSDSTVIKMTQSGMLTVTEPGEIEILLVGGGGGAGGDNSNLMNQHGGGGGGGGVVHIRNLSVAAGAYPITIGAGGAVNTGARASGGKTTGFDYTALGGGPGAYVSGGGSIDNLGASGGGGSIGNGKTGGMPTVYAENLGHAGADATDMYNSGGGGGAGTAGSGVKGGDGYLCDITGEAVYYAGGGGGGRGWAAPGDNGLGGGCENYGGGGRAAGDYTLTSPQTGGPGIAIVKFTRKPAKNETVFDDATGGTVTRCRVDGVKYQVHTFAQSGQFAIPHHGHVEVLVVGGGGGGGANISRSGENSHNGSNTFYGGGGGAGGVIHKRDLFLTNGVYDIVIGAGGPVNGATADTYVNGGDTTAFGLTAFGGGCGACGYAYNAARSGASGGGGSQTYWNGAGDKANGAEPKADYINSPYNNLGNAGGDARFDAGTGGGGGGAGGAASGVNGGVAYVSSITGVDVAYAGGGGGYYWGVQSVPGGGSGSYGGGGNSNGPGGGGVVIVRYQLPQYGMIVILK